MRKTKFTVKTTSAFRKDYKLAMKRGLDIQALDRIITILSMGEPLPKKYNDHSLSNNWKGYRECHIEPNWLLIYRIDQNVLILTLTRTGTHSDLFNK